jgi:hypothetical protein
MDQFAGKPTLVMLARLHDQDRPAEPCKGGGGGASRNPTPGDDGIDVGRHSAASAGPA